MPALKIERTIRVTPVDDSRMRVEVPVSSQCRGGFAWPTTTSLVGIIDKSHGADKLEMDMIKTSGTFGGGSIFFKGDVQNTREAIQSPIDNDCILQGCGPSGENCKLRQRISVKVTDIIRSKKRWFGLF